MKLVEMTEAEANVLLQDHYLGAIGYTSIYCLAPESRDAVAVYASPIAQAFKTAFPTPPLHPKATQPRYSKPLELTRLFKSPTASFATSEFLAATLRWVRGRTAAPCVFSYADPGQLGPDGEPHGGTIYKATGFTKLGMSTITHRYRTPEGAIISSPVCYRRFGTKDVKQILRRNPTWVQLPGVRKILFVYPLRMDTQAIIDRLPRYAAQQEKVNAERAAERQARLDNPRRREAFDAHGAGL